MTISGVASVAARDPTTAALERLAKNVNAAFEKGYDQAVDEIRGYFAKAGQHGVVAEIDATFRKVRAS
jgi:hypothetical protein